MPGKGRRSRPAGGSDLKRKKAFPPAKGFAAAAKKEYARQKALSKTPRPQRDTAAAMGVTAKGPGLKGPFGDVAPNPTEEDPARIGGR